MAIVRLTDVKKTDGTTRLVSEVFRDNDVVTSVKLEPGEVIISSQQASTVTGSENRSDKKLIAEMRALRQVALPTNWDDIVRKIE